VVLFCQSFQSSPAPYNNNNDYDGNNDNNNKEKRPFQLLAWLNFYRATACNETHAIAYSIFCQSVRPSVCLSVCLSVHQKRGLWQNERNMCSHSYTTWKIFYTSFSFTLVFCQKSGWWRRPILPEIFGPNWPCWSENADFQSIFARSATAVTVTPSKKFN